MTYVLTGVGIFCFGMLITVLAGCAGSVRGNALQFQEARDNYLTCAKARGSAACQAERDVMFATSPSGSAVVVPQ